MFLVERQAYALPCTNHNFPGQSNIFRGTQLSEEQEEREEDEAYLLLQRGSTPFSS